MDEVQSLSVKFGRDHSAWHDVELGEQWLWCPKVFVQFDVVRLGSSNLPRKFGPGQDEQDLPG